jgi:hypothetical protein
MNSLSGGAAPSSFKGFANSTNPNPAHCGGSWMTDPGNTLAQPSTVPTFITVIAASSITQSGSIIMGDIPRMVIVETDPGYDSSLGIPGTGTVVQVICPGTSTSAETSKSFIFDTSVRWLMTILAAS